MTNYASNLPKRTQYALYAAALIVLAGSGWFIYNTYFKSSSMLDISIIKAINSASEVTSYVQQVDTAVAFPDRRMSITGIFLVDTPNKRFASFSTTSLFVGTDPTPHVFSHQNVAINDDVYTKVETSDPLLTSSIAHGPNWAYYKNGSIPKEKQDIAIVGPVQDNLQILSDNGAYLTYVRKVGPASWAVPTGTQGNENLLRYTFKLSKKAFTVSDGPLKAIVGRVGTNGTVDIWIDDVTHTAVHMVFSNDPYFSTTTLSGINTPLNISAPIQKPS